MDAGRARELMVTFRMQSKTGTSVVRIELIAFQAVPADGKPA
jgi:hypothetical protein